MEFIDSSYTIQNFLNTHYLDDGRVHNVSSEACNAVFIIPKTHSNRFLTSRPAKGYIELSMSEDRLGKIQANHV
jgi:hypothetical protein